MVACQGAIASRLTPTEQQIAGNKKPADNPSSAGFLFKQQERSEIFQPPHLISRRLVGMAQLERRHNSHDQLIRHHKFNLPFLNPLNLPCLTNKRLTPVQRSKLAQTKHLPRTVVIVTDPPTTGSEHSPFDHLDMTVRNKKR
jgi:hypothetical protein